MKYITNEEIAKLITPKKAIELVEQSFRLKNNAILPTKTSIHMNDINYFNTMPAIIPDLEIMGVKVIDRYLNRNIKVDGEIFIYDYNNGNLKYMLDAFWITTARTGAVCALAIKYLAKSNFSTIGIMGLGATGTASLACILEDNKNKPLQINLLRYKNHCEKIIENFRHYKNATFNIIDNIEELIKSSDVFVSCITNTTSLLAKPEWFKEGTLIVPIHNKGFQNCDQIFDKVFGDDTSHISGFKYFDKFKYFAELPDVITGKNKGRTNDKERIISYNLGLVIHDLVYSKYIIDNLKSKSTEILLSDKNNFVFKMK